MQRNKSMFIVQSFLTHHRYSDSLHHDNLPSVHVFVGDYSLYTITHLS